MHDSMSDEERFRLKWAALSLYLAGSDTVRHNHYERSRIDQALFDTQTVSSLQFTFFALAMNPTVLAKAQEEIDAVVGDSRLPCLEDQKSLPYTNAVAAEIFRFNSVTPIGVPHVVSQDDIYNGYSIPANSILIANIEGMLHDPLIYQDPYKFDPTRFLPKLSGRPAERDPQTIGFGFGRRKCAGLRIAEASIFITMAMAAAVFDIGLTSENGEAAKPVYEKLPGAVSHPKPFDISIKLRSKKAEALLNTGK
jgi:cytochrome P450